MSEVNQEEDINSISVDAEPNLSSAAVESESLTPLQDPPPRKRGRPPGTTKKNKKKNTTSSSSSNSHAASKKSTKSLNPSTNPIPNPSHPSSSSILQLRPTTPHIPTPKRRRTLSVYDVVANRMTRGGFRDKTRSHITTFADEVLARSSHAPLDISPFPLEKKPLLPNNELLFAVHQYAADFYTMNGLLGVNQRSFDETALIAVASLLENGCEGLLGEKGHLVLVDRELLNEREEEEDGNGDSQEEDGDGPVAQDSGEEVGSD